MNVIEENVRDEKLLARLDLELLDQGVVAHGDGLAELVGQHNAKLPALSERHSKLVDGRKRLVDFNAWAGVAVNDVIAERAKLARQAWDWLRDLRAALVEREAILKKAEHAVWALLTAADQQRQRAVDRLTKSMAKTRRECLAASPVRGEGHFAQLVESDAAIVAIDERHARLKSDLESITDLRRRAGGDHGAVLNRQEEIFNCLVA